MKIKGLFTRTIHSGHTELASVTGKFSVLLSSQIKGVQQADGAWIFTRGFDRFET